MTADDHFPKAVIVTRQKRLGVDESALQRCDPRDQQLCVTGTMARGAVNESGQRGEFMDVLVLVGVHGARLIRHEAGSRGEPGGAGGGRRRTSKGRGLAISAAMLLPDFVSRMAHNMWCELCCVLRCVLLVAHGWPSSAHPWQRDWNVAESSRHSPWHGPAKLLRSARPRVCITLAPTVLHERAQQWLNSGEKGSHAHLPAPKHQRCARGQRTATIRRIHHLLCDTTSSRTNHHHHQPTGHRPRERSGRLGRRI